MSLDTIQKTLKQMDSNIKNLQTDINNNRVPQNEDDKFLEVMEKFAKEARDQCDVMQNMFKKMDNLYTDLSDYFSFDKQKYTLEEFFGDLKTFKDNFIVSPLFVFYSLFNFSLPSTNLFCINRRQRKTTIVSER